MDKDLHPFSEFALAAVDNAQRKIIIIIINLNLSFGSTSWISFHFFFFMCLKMFNTEYYSECSGKDPVSCETFLLAAFHDDLQKVSDVDWDQLTIDLQFSLIVTQ